MDREVNGKTAAPEKRQNINQTAKIKKEPRVSAVSATLMICTAIIFDLVSLIPLINIITGALALLTFGMWFIIKDVSLVSPSRLTTGLLAGIIEVYPVLSMLPATTIGVIIVIISSRFEDKTGVKVPLSAKPKVQSRPPSLPPK